MKRTRKEKRQYKKAFQEAMAKELREHRSSFIVFLILRLLVIVVLVRQLMLANYEMCIRDSLSAADQPLLFSCNFSTDNFHFQ